MSFSKIIADKSFKISAVLAFVFLTAGFILLHYGLTVYGWAFFILLPIVIGISIGALPSIKWAYAGLVFGLILFLVLLLIGGLEGFLCVLMALPLIISCIFLGSVMSYLFKHYRHIKSTTNLKIFLAPLFICIAGLLVEGQFNNQPKVITVETEIILPYSADHVFDEIKSVEKIDTEKSLLFYVGLPEPQRCVLKKEAVGAKRICYFEGGKIVERVVEYERGKVLKMEVIDYRLTGRKWLGFKDAIYNFEKTGKSQTKLTRITTYTSVLYPRVYWQPLEVMGIEEEHDYVFRNLREDLAENYSVN